MANFVEVEQEDQEPSLRKRIANALLNATAPDPDEEIQSPWQAIGNATHQIAGAYAQRKADALKKTPGNGIGRNLFKKPIFGG